MGEGSADTRAEAAVAGSLNAGEVAAHLALLYDAYVETVASGTGEALDAAVRRLREADHSREVDHVNGHAGDIVEPLLLLHHVVSPPLLAAVHRDAQTLDARSVEVPELSASRAWAPAGLRHRASPDMPVPILRRGQYLIAAIQAAPTDADLLHLRDALVQQAGLHRAQGVIVDVTALDVTDSFA